MATLRRFPSHVRFWTGGFVLLFVLLLPRVKAQGMPEAQPASFLRSNDRFALDLLKTAHQEIPDSNIVVAPLPVSLMFAALWDATPDSESWTELQSVFHWEDRLGTDVAGRMLLNRFEKPKPYPKPHTLPQDNFAKRLLTRLPKGKPEELWLSAAFLYRGKDSLSPDFIDRVKYNYGFTFRDVGEHAPQVGILAKNWDASLPMPDVTGYHDFWITSATHLRTSWAGNTFIGAKREKHDFQLRSGDVVQADFLKSEVEVYAHAHTDEFEAIVLACREASILLVLPTLGRTIEGLEAAFAKNPDMVEPVLARAEGDVQMPPFHFFYKVDLQRSLEKMGVHRIFTDPNTLMLMTPNRAGGLLRGVAQKTEITVDENGIRADSGTIFSGVYGGILAPREPFHMTLSRPFLFLIRDTATSALLFAGVVMNPAAE
jgi:serine protease inhibitor